MLLQTNTYIVPPEKRSEHSRLMRRFRQTLLRLGCHHFEVYEQVGANWSSGESAGRFVQILRFVDRKHQLAVQAAERTDPSAQAVITEFCDLINFQYQQEQGMFAVSFFTSALPMTSRQPAEEMEFEGEASGEAEAVGEGAVLGAAASAVAEETIAPDGESMPEAADAQHAELEPAHSEPDELEPAELEPAELEPAELEPAALEPDGLEEDAEVLPAIGQLPVNDELETGFEPEPASGFAETLAGSHMKLVEDETVGDLASGEKTHEPQTYGRIEPAFEAETLSDLEPVEELEPEEEEELTPISNGHEVAEHELHAEEDLEESSPEAEAESESELHPIGEALDDDDEFHAVAEPERFSPFSAELEPATELHASAEPAEAELEPDEPESDEELSSTAMHETPMHETPMHETPVHETPVHETPVHETPVHESRENHPPIHHPRHEDDFMSLVKGELTEEDEERAHGFIEGELVDEIENEHLNGLSGHTEQVDELTGHEVRPAPKHNSQW